MMEFSEMIKKVDSSETSNTGRFDIKWGRTGGGGATVHSLFRMEAVSGSNLRIAGVSNGDSRSGWDEKRVERHDEHCRSRWQPKWRVRSGGQSTVDSVFLVVNGDGG